MVGLPIDVFGPASRTRQEIRSRSVIEDGVACLEIPMSMKLDMLRELILGDMGMMTNRWQLRVRDNETLFKERLRYNKPAPPHRTTLAATARRRSKHPLRLFEITVRAALLEHAEPHRLLLPETSLREGGGSPSKLQMSALRTDMLTDRLQAWTEKDGWLQYDNGGHALSMDVDKHLRIVVDGAYDPDISEVGPAWW